MFILSRAKKKRYPLGTEQGTVFIFCALGVALALYYFPSALWLTAIGGVLFLTLAYLRLDLGLLYVVFSAPFYLFPKRFSPDDLGLATLLSRAVPLEFSLTEFTILACLVAWLVGWVKSPSRVSLPREEGRTLTLRQLWQAPWETNPPFWLNPVIWLFIAATLSLLASEYLRFSLREYRTIIVEPLIFSMLLIDTVRTQEQVWRFFNAFVLLGLAVAVASLYHYFFIGVVEATEGVRRILAIYHSPNALALFLGRVAPPAIALALWGETERWQRLFYVLASLSVLATLYFTYSRGAWVSVLVAIIFVAAMRGWREVFAVGGAVLMALAVLLTRFPWGRLVSESTTQQRWHLWQAALNMIKDHPILGVGLDNFLYQYPKYILREALAEPNISHPHNIVLDFWTRTGIIGLAAILWLQVTFWRRGLMLYRRLTDTKIQVLVLALMASMVDFLVHGLIDNSFFLIDLAIIFWLTYGLMVVIGRLSERSLARSVATSSAVESKPRRSEV